MPSLQDKAQLDRSRQASPQICEVLRGRILTLALPPDTLLSRASLQAEFGVSQTPVRDALMKLEQEGLVAVFPQHATVVTRIDVRAARQAHILRLAIELEAVRRAAPVRTAAMIASARQAIDLQRRLVGAGEHAAFVEADRAFHKVFHDAAGITDLWHLVRRHSGHIDRLRCLNLPMPGKIEAILAAHETILAAIEAADGEAAAAAMRGHLSGTLSIIDDIRARYPDYLTED